MESQHENSAGIERRFAWSDGLILLDGPAPLLPNSSANTALIVPGERIGSIRLGMSESQVVQLLGTQSERTEFEGTTLEHEMEVITRLNQLMGRNDTIEDFPPQPPCLFLDYNDHGLSVRFVHDYAMSIFAFDNVEPRYEVGRLKDFFTGTASSDPEAIATRNDVHRHYGEPSEIIEGSTADPPNDMLCYASGVSFEITRQPECVTRVVVTPAG